MLGGLSGASDGFGGGDEAGQRSDMQELNIPGQWTAESGQRTVKGGSFLGEWRTNERAETATKLGEGRRRGSRQAGNSGCWECNKKGGEDTQVRGEKGGVA